MRVINPEAASAVLVSIVGYGMRTLLTLLVLAAACSGESRRAAVETLRSAANPPAPPPDTVPEFLDYAADLQVDLSDMVKLGSGVLYRDLATGTGPELAEGDSVVVHYQGWLPNGVLVDSALAGIRVGAGDALPGIDAALPGMKVGGIRKLVLSPGLAFGAEGASGIPPGSVLVYDLEVRNKLP
jgi:peptidylprolyl isomerase